MMMIFTIVGNICVCLFDPDRLGIRFNQLPCNLETGLEQTSESPPAETAVNCPGASTDYQHMQAAVWGLSGAWPASRGGACSKWVSRMSGHERLKVFMGVFGIARLVSWKIPIYADHTYHTCQNYSTHHTYQIHCTYHLFVWITLVA